MPIDKSGPAYLITTHQKVKAIWLWDVIDWLIDFNGMSTHLGLL